MKPSSNCKTAEVECVVRWAHEDGYRLEPYRLDISDRLVQLARYRLPMWRDRIFVGNALFWKPPKRFEYVRTELVYVPPTRRHEYVERLLKMFVARIGRLIICAYGSSRPEGCRAEPLVDEIRGWGLAVEGVHDVRRTEHGFIITRVVSLLSGGAAQPPHAGDGVRRRYGKRARVVLAHAVPDAERSADLR